MFPRDEKIKRIKNLISKFEKKLPLIVTSTSDIFYLTGFPHGGMLIVFKDQLTLITSIMLLQDVRIFSSDVLSEVKTYRTKDEYLEILSECLKRADVFFTSENISTSTLKLLKKKSKIRTLKSSPVGELRAIKSKYEIETIKKALRLTEETIIFAVRKATTPKTEMETKAELIKYGLTKGAVQTSFDPIVAFGKNSSRPHYISSDITLNAGDNILIDLGFIINGYCSDMTRTFYTYPKNKELMRIHKIVEKAVEEAVKEIKDGIEAGKIDEAARKVIEKEGLGDYFIHGTGHGVGIDVHEGISLNIGVKEKVKAGMVITIEPGVYIEGIGGVRIEDMVLVRKNCGEVLTDFSRAPLIFQIIGH